MNPRELYQELRNRYGKNIAVLSRPIYIGGMALPSRGFLLQGIANKEGTTEFRVVTKTMTTFVCGTLNLPLYARGTGTYRIQLWNVWYTDLKLEGVELDYEGTVIHYGDVESIELIEVPRALIREHAPHFFRKYLHGIEATLKATGGGKGLASLGTIKLGEIENGN